jgi:hypothetical protein
MRNELKQYICVMLVALLCGATAWAQEFDPSNPPDPQMLYKVVATATNGHYTSGSGSYTLGTQVTINTSASSTGFDFKHWTKDGVVYASATNALGQIARPTGSNMFLTQGSSSGAPQWSLVSASEHISKKGTGSTSASSLASVTFSKLPNLVYIMIPASSGGVTGWGVLMPASGYGYSMVNGVWTGLVVSTSGTTVKWYGVSGGAANHLNTAGWTYHFVGIY